jgi:hypothetical protein
MCCGLIHSLFNYWDFVCATDVGHMFACTAKPDKMLARAHFQLGLASRRQFACSYCVLPECSYWMQKNQFNPAYKKQE